MNNEKRSKKITNYIFSSILILGLICLLTLKESTLLKKVICFESSKKMKDDKFEITNNLDEIFEKQVSISSDEVGEINEIESNITFSEENVFDNQKDDQIVDDAKEIK